LKSFNQLPFYKAHFMDLSLWEPFVLQDFARKAFSTVLLHKVPMSGELYAPYQNARCLEDLAEGLFAI
jgi:hypothetical protein